MVKIISDSTCDLSEELLEKYKVAILPLHILLGEDEYEDGKDNTRNFGAFHGEYAKAVQGSV